jgi:putative acetyltransferase
LHEVPSLKACLLAPLAVCPAFQKQGIAAALIRHSLKRLAETDHYLAVVLGEPRHYGRFGFTSRLAEKLKTPYDGPYLQALALSDKGKDAHGPVSYARAFAELK